MKFINLISVFLGVVYLENELDILYLDLDKEKVVLGFNGW